MSEGCKRRQWGIKISLFLLDELRSFIDFWLNSWIKFWLMRIKSAKWKTFLQIFLLHTLNYLFNSGPKQSVRCACVLWCVCLCKSCLSGQPCPFSPTVRLSVPSKVTSSEHHCQKQPWILFSFTTSHTSWYRLPAGMKACTGFLMCGAANIMPLMRPIRQPSAWAQHPSPGYLFG